MLAVIVGCVNQTVKRSISSKKYGVWYVHQT